MEQFLVVVAGEEKSAALAILEVREQCVRELARPDEVLHPESRLQQFEQRVQKEGVIVEIAVQVGVVAEARGEQPAVAPHGALE